LITTIASMSRWHHRREQGFAHPASGTLSFRLAVIGVSGTCLVWVAHRWRHLPNPGVDRRHARRPERIRETPRSTGVALTTPPKVCSNLQG
jgi:hypothetical protein